MPTVDPRVHVTAAHLRSLLAEAAGLTPRPRLKANAGAPGHYPSRLLGRGLDFEEMRAYRPGDDVRSIDWKATARTGQPYVRSMTEHLDRSALLLIDQRSSMFYGSVLNMKSVTAAEAAALCACALQAQGNRVGGLICQDEAVAELPFCRGQAGLNRLLSRLASDNQALSAAVVPQRVHTLNTLLSRLTKRVSHSQLLILFSDFAGFDEASEKHLAAISEHNDLILMPVYDPSARHIEQKQTIAVTDGRQQAALKLSDSNIAQAVQTATSQRLDALLALADRRKLSILPLSAGERTLPQLQRLLDDAAPGRPSFG